jgi:hypothetical protein
MTLTNELSQKFETSSSDDKINDIQEICDMLK